MHRFVFILIATALNLQCVADDLMASNRSANQQDAIRSASPMVVRYQKLPAFAIAHAYRYELLNQILEITRPEFGDYQYKYYETETSPKRQAQLISEGTALNMDWTSPGTPVATADVIPIEIDFLNGLLSYRICMVNHAAPLNAEELNDVESLKKIKIGQGNWVDADFYTYNHITPMIAPNFDSLFMMLSAKRFDCLALGINEIGTILDEKKQQFHFLEIDKNLLIYYYFPTYFYVSKKTPELAKRIEMGLNKLKKNGMFDQLFMKFHGKNLEGLDLNNRKVICLKSPYVKNNDTCNRPQHYHVD